jgi:outer membrane receptor for ferrienterochelin and colicins
MPRSACATILALVCSFAAHAAEPIESNIDAKPVATKKEPIARVEVKAKADDYDPRRDDTASKTVMTQEEILKYGDTNVYDVLKRAPGVTVVGNSIRMRGLGNGYTQILVNGERPPPGFSLDTVPPDQIERIEIIRAASAEFSMQAIAGTVNVVLKKVVAKPQKDGRLTFNHADEKQSQYLNASLADKRGNLSWYVNVNVQHNLREATTTELDRFTAPDDTVTLLRDEVVVRRNTNRIVGLAPRLNWKLSDNDQLNLSGNVLAQHAASDDAGLDTNRIGGLPAPDYVRGRERGDSSGRFGWVELNWVAKLWGGKLDAKLRASNGDFDVRTDRLMATADDALRFARLRDGHLRFPAASSSGKFTRSLFDGHALAAGWDISREKRYDRAHRMDGVVGQVPLDFIEEFDPRVRRAAAFLQDEWNVTRQWSMYLGARWEGIRTDSSGTGLLDSTSNTHVLSPVAQTLYKFPDKSGRQLRLALTHTFKAPDTNQLSARRFEAETNTRFSPDISGNPALRPEQANGVDLTYEHFWAPGAVFSVGGSQRRIQDTIRTVLGQDVNGRWLYHPVNDGNALVRTFDVDVKFPLKAVMRAGAPPVDLRFNLNRNWSKVETVPGPDNRLDKQIPLSVVFGADYKKEPFSWGINLAYREGGMVRVSQEQSAQLQARRDVDGYVQYSPRKGLDLRLSVGNGLGVDDLGYSRYRDASGTSEMWTRSPQSMELRFNVGVKFM